MNLKFLTLLIIVYYNSPSRLSGLNYPVIKSICHQFIQYAIHSVQNASVKATQDQIEILR